MEFINIYNRTNLLKKGAERKYNKKEEKEERPATQQYDQNLVKRLCYHILPFFEVFSTVYTHIYTLHYL